MQRLPRINCYGNKTVMKHPPGKLSLLALLLCLAACTKTTGKKTMLSNGPESPGIPGEWNLVTDSTFEGVGSANHPVNYTGEPGDYFSFSDNGYVYTKEGNVLDTLTYQVVSVTKIIISDFGLILNGVADTSTVTGLTGSIDSGNTADTIVIESPFFLTPGGEFWRKVTLYR
jgi:hypothetical protein